jgi:hypothetical protein
VGAANIYPGQGQESGQIIDGFDFLQWQRQASDSPGGFRTADWNFDLSVDGNDLALWRTQFGQGVRFDASWAMSMPGSAGAASAALLASSSAAAAVDAVYAAGDFTALFATPAARAREYRPGRRGLF